VTYPIGPGGVIAETEHWIVDHTFGALGIGTLIVKPKRVVLHVGELDDAEAAELGPLLQRAARVVEELAGADQVYVCLWSHMDRRPGHIHFVVQPVTQQLMAEHDAHGPQLQVALFRAGVPPDDAEAAEFADAARAIW
jgi:diadenosine tetraphosphate (Ap4A) HIT family hydrolase